MIDCAGTVSCRVRADQAMAGIDWMALAEVRRQTLAVPDLVKWPRLSVTGVVPLKSLLITITVIAPSLLRSAAKAERSSGAGTLADTETSPKVEPAPS